MLSKTYSLLIITAFVYSAVNGNLQLMGESCIKGVLSAVDFMIELGSLMAFWSAVMAVFEKCGFLRIFARIIQPITRLVFPDAYKNKVALQEISMNIGANFLGLGNAATPMGLKAMEKMNDGLKNSFDMVMLTVLNTASVQLIPTTLISLRIISGSANPYEIVLPIWICSVITVTFAVIITKTLGYLYTRTTLWKR